MILIGRGQKNTKNSQKLAKKTVCVARTLRARDTSKSTTPGKPNGRHFSNPGEKAS